jgi:hypothetical protein
VDSPDAVLYRASASALISSSRYSTASSMLMMPQMRDRIERLGPAVRQTIGFVENKTGGNIQPDLNWHNFHEYRNRSD